MEPFCSKCGSKDKVKMDYSNKGSISYSCKTCHGDMSFGPLVFWGFVIWCIYKHME